MRLSKITRKQVDQVLKENPIHEVLNVGKTALTPKQLKYCENVARGDTQAGAYRKAYNTKAKPAIQANEAHKLSKRPDIAVMTDAIKKGLEWEKSYSLAQTRALVVERLTKEALDEDSSPSARINALKALGTVAGVDAFVHRTETTVIKDSSKIRDDLMAQLKDAMQANTIDMDADELELLSEINPTAKRKGDIADPPTPDPTHGQKESPQILHSNPDKQSPSETKSENLSENIQQNHEVPEQVSTLTVDLSPQEGGGGVKNDPDWKEDSIGKTPVSGFKTKG
jgi:hypothetical protein